jgi:hypothetical protein
MSCFSRESLILFVIPARRSTTAEWLVKPETHLDLVPMESRSKWTPAYAGVTKIVVDQSYPGEILNKYGTHSSRASSLPQNQAMVGASLLATILVQTFPGSCVLAADGWL